MFLPTFLLMLATLMTLTVAEKKPTTFDFRQAGRTVTVRYFVPPGATPHTPVVFVMHGILRNGADYLADWTPFAKQHKFLLVVPEFSKKEFPGAEGYIYGNTVDAAGKAVPRNQWSFSMIEPIFDAVKKRTGNAESGYRIFGHSAGAQFVHRFIYFVPAARVLRAVGANAGWYMLPDRSVAFPYGLKNTPVSAQDLKHAFLVPLVVLLGTADTNPNDPLLRHTPQADAQGLFRFARGKYFFSYAKAAARRSRLAIRWRLATAPGIGHTDKGMAPFGVRALFSK